MAMKGYNIIRSWATIAKYSLCVITLVGSTIVSSCSNDDVKVDIDEGVIYFGASSIDEVQNQDTRALFHNASEFNKHGRQMLVCSFKYEINTTNEI